MELVLEREYWPFETNGSIKLDGKIICHTKEPPAFHFNPNIPCVPEGAYHLFFIERESGPFLELHRIFKGTKESKKWVVEIGIEKLHQNVVLVHGITEEDKGVPCHYAWEHFLQLVGHALNSGKKVSLEIKSCPEQALNLTYHQILWMD